MLAARDVARLSGLPLEVVFALPATAYRDLVERLVARDEWAVVTKQAQRH